MVASNSVQSKEATKQTIGSTVPETMSSQTLVMHLTTSKITLTKITTQDRRITFLKIEQCLCACRGFFWQFMGANERQREPLESFVTPTNELAWCA
jgi:hypothetical protein